MMIMSVDLHPEFLWKIIFQHELQNMLRIFPVCLLFAGGLRSISVASPIQVPFQPIGQVVGDKLQMDYSTRLRL